MKRNCIIIHRPEEFNTIYDRYICIDEENWEEIYECIQNKRKKWKMIVERTITQSNLYWDSYAKESIDNNSKKVTAIKFFDQENTRIYCQELSIKGKSFYIVCSVLLLSKKVQQNDKRINEIIKKISNYEYEILE